MSLKIGKAIYSILSNYEPITNKIGKKIFPLVSELNTTFPFIVYKRSTIETQYTKDLKCAESVLVDFVIASDNYEESINVAQILRDCLENTRGRYADIVIKKIRLEDSDEDYNEDTYLQYLTFKFSL